MWLQLVTQDTWTRHSRLKSAFTLQRKRSFHLKVTAWNGFSKHTHAPKKAARKTESGFYEKIRYGGMGYVWLCCEGDLSYQSIGRRQILSLSRIVCDEHQIVKMLGCITTFLGRLRVDGLLDPAPKNELYNRWMHRSDADKILWKLRKIAIFQADFIRNTLLIRSHLSTK